MLPDIVPVVLAGGEGKRLRPLTHATPKPFLKLFSKYSMLQLTLLRGAGFAPPVIVCDAGYARQAEDEAREIGFTATIIAEPARRGTAAAVAVAAMVLEQANPLMIVMPSDHLIDSAKVFRDGVARAVGQVPQDGVLIFGKRPENAQNRYGFIKARDVKLESFVEKPDPRTARTLSKSPNVFWNTGIFMGRASSVAGLFDIHAPEIAKAAARAVVSIKRQGNILMPDAALFAGIPPRSIDHAIMERLTKGVVLPLETGWHDVGCWDSVFAQKYESLTRTLKPSRHEPGR